MTDDVLLKRCQREAIVETSKDVGRGILSFIIAVLLFLLAIGIFAGIMMFGDFLTLVLEPYRDIISSIVLVFAVLFIGISCIGGPIWLLYDKYKEHLVECVERIKSEKHAD